VFTRVGSTSEFDSVIAVEGTLKRPDVNGEMLVDLVMMYLNQKTGISYGSCKVTKGLFSKETQELLDKFLLSAEEDFGNIAFGEGVITTQEGSIRTLGSAEDPTGKLDPKSLGGV
jgi:hypothetical protein